MGFAILTLDNVDMPEGTDPGLLRTAVNPAHVAMVAPLAGGTCLLHMAAPVSGATRIFVKEDFETVMAMLDHEAIPFAKDPKRYAELLNGRSGVFGERRAWPGDPDGAGPGGGAG